MTIRSKLKRIKRPLKKLTSKNCTCFRICGSLYDIYLNTDDLIEARVHAADMAIMFADNVDAARKHLERAAKLAEDKEAVKKLEDFGSKWFVDLLDPKRWPKLKTASTSR